MTHTGDPKRVIFYLNEVEFQNMVSGDIIAKGVANQNSKLYEFSHFIPLSKQSSLHTHANEESRLWHEIFGHLNYKYLQDMHTQEMVEGLPKIKFSKGNCHGCLMGKHPENKFEKGKARRASQPLDLIHSDVAGPFPDLSLNKARYILTFIDDYSRFTWIYFLRLKSEVFGFFKFFKSPAEKFSDRKIKAIHTDNGGEYVKGDFQSVCADEGIEM